MDSYVVIGLNHHHHYHHHHHHRACFGHGLIKQDHVLLQEWECFWEQWYTCNSSPAATTRYDGKKLSQPTSSGTKNVIEFFITVIRFKCIVCREGNMSKWRRRALFETVQNRQDGTKEKPCLIGHSIR
jgi:hypothetical protein